MLQANHVSQRLAEPEAKKSKIAEFGLSLDGQTAGWYAQHKLDDYMTFEDLRDKSYGCFTDGWRNGN